MKTHEVINLLYGSCSFSGTEQECWNWVHTNYGKSNAALLLDVRKIPE